MNPENEDIEYVCSYAEMQKGYVLCLQYKDNTPQAFAYVAKEDIDDFENKMVEIELFSIISKQVGSVYLESTCFVFPKC